MGNPKKTKVSADELSKLQAEINDTNGEDVAVRDLQMVTKSGLEIMKKGEEEKSKQYTAKLWCPVDIPSENIRKLNARTEIALQQKTPIRVLHRRPLATRTRLVHNIELKATSSRNYYELSVLTQAGTYIKELVHGDLG